MISLNTSGYLTEIAIQQVTSVKWVRIRLNQTFDFSSGISFPGERQSVWSVHA